MLYALRRFFTNFEPILGFSLPLPLTHSCPASPIAHPAAPCLVSSPLTENCCQAMRGLDS
jgi:hypothetical protein